jgi:hypothetical protein
VRKPVVAIEDRPIPGHPEDAGQVVVEQRPHGAVALGRRVPSGRQPGGDLRVVWHTMPQ